MKKKILKMKLLVILLLIISAAARGGVYFYRCRNRVHYVGRTNNFERRHKEHVRDGRYFANCRMDKFVTSDRNRIEKYYIKKYQPPANKKDKN